MVVLEINQNITPEVIKANKIKLKFVGLQIDAIGEADSYLSANISFLNVKTVTEDVVTQDEDGNDIHTPTDREVVKELEIRTINLSKAEVDSFEWGNDDSALLAWIIANKADQIK